IAGAAEPGEKRRHGAEIEPRRAVRPAAMAVHVPQMNAVIEMQVGHMQVYAAGQERQGAHAEPHEKTDEIKSRPGHERLLGLGAGVEGGAFNTSIKRSASPGFSKIVPNRIKHIRESSCLANVFDPVGDDFGKSSPTGSNTFANPHVWRRPT